MGFEMKRIVRNLATSAVLCILAAASVAAERPNVLMICVDDLKPALACYGDALAKSPNIDALAARGMRFDRAFCNQAVCAPSRNALLTGLRPQTLGIYDLATNFRKAAPDAVTLPQHFKANGYRTEGMGKIFHVGHGNHEDPTSWSVPHWHKKVVSYALPESRAAEGLTREEARFENVGDGRARKLPKGAAYEAADVPDDAYADGQIAEEAVRRLQSAAKNPDEPFFMAVGFVKPHLPFCAPKKYWDLYDPKEFKLAERRTPPDGAPAYAPTTWVELRQYQGVADEGTLPDEQQRTLIHGYYAAMSYMDAQVGRVLAALDETGLAENTIIVFWGDHGWHLGDHGMWCKHSNYEQAARIPLLIVAPGVAKPGTESGSLVESVDIYPTLCELTGLEAPAALDGASFVSNLRDPAAAGEAIAFHVFPRGERLGRAVRTERYRLVEWKMPGAAAETAELELYDYQADAGETKNLAAEQPAVVAELRAALDQQAEAKPQITVTAPPRQQNAGQRRRARAGK
jgi:iduronate 2-sulfatase